MPVIQCPSCGNIEDIRSAVCSECGAPIAPLKMCEECGEPLESYNKFCPKCGYPVENAPNAVISPAANYTGGQSVPISRNIYSPPPEAPLSEHSPAAGKGKALMIFNIIGLLLMILPTVLFMGKALDFKVNQDMVKDYSFAEFSDTADYVKNYVGAGISIVKIFGGSNNDLDSFYNYLEFLSALKYVYYAVILFSAYKFISGCFKVNKGKLLAYCFNVSWLYFILGVLLNATFIEPVNDLIPGTAIAFGLSFRFKYILGIAVIHFIFYIVLVFVTRNYIKNKS